MNAHAAHDPRGAGTPADVGAAEADAETNIEYRIAHLQERLASGELGELGMRVEPRGSAVTVMGTVPTAHCREELLRTVNEELAGLAVHYDIVVAEAAAPDHPEEVA
jgi:hypothetical protein